MSAPLVTCEACGQTCIADDGWTVRGRGECCRAEQYGGGERHELARLFEPAPEQLAGQLELGEDFAP